MKKRKPAPGAFYRAYDNEKVSSLEEAVEQAIERATAFGMTDLEVAKSGILKNGNYWVELRGRRVTKKDI